MLMGGFSEANQPDVPITSHTYFEFVKFLSKIYDPYMEIDGIVFYLGH